MNKRILIHALFGTIAILLSPAPAGQAAEGRMGNPAGPRPATSLVTGRVVNSKTGAYLGGARVSVSGTSIWTVTTRDGTFRLANLPAGDVSLDVSYTGLESQVIEVAASRRGLPLEIELASEIYKMEAFMVSELTEGNAAAITEQRNAMNVKNVAATDAFGSMRDGNVAELLVLMPGVVGRFVGNDIRTIQIRGFHANLGSVTVDGSKMGNAESGKMNRNFEFDGLTADHVESVEVIKAPTPDMGADSIGGTVNMKTKSALNYSGGRRVTASFGYAYERKRNTLLPGGNFYYSEVLGKNRNLGVSLNVGYSEHSVPRDGTTLTYPSKTNRPNHMQFFRIFDQLNTRVRFGTGLRLDYKLRENTTLYFNSMLTMSNEQLENDFMGRRVVVRSNSKSVAAGYTDDRVEFLPTNSTRVTQELIKFPKGHQATFWAFGGSHRWSDWLLEGDVTFSRDLQHYDAVKNKYGQMYSDLRGIGVVLDRTGGNPSLPTVTQVSGPNMWDVANFKAGPLNQRDWRGVDAVWSVRGDLTREFDTELPFTLKVGGRHTAQARLNTRGDRRHIYVGPDGVANSGDESLLPFLDDHNRTLIGGLYPAPRWASIAKIAQANYEHPTWFQEDPKVFALSRLRFDRKIWEDVTGAYVMGTLQMEKLRVLAGLRYESTDVKGISNQNRISPEERATRAAWVGPVTPAESIRRLEAQYSTRVTRTSSYDNVFPGLHLKYDFNRGLVARASYTTSIGRPNFESIVPTENVNEETEIITANNVGLRPQFGDSFNVALEYYFEPAGVVSVGAFHTKINDFIFSKTNAVGTGADNGFDGLYPGFELRTSDNGGEATIKGIELNYIQQLVFLPGWMSSLSVFGNYTHLKTSGDYGGSSASPVTDLAGFVPKAANIGIALTRWGLDIRVKSTYKGGFLSRYSTNAGAVRRRHPRTNIDLNILYRFTPRYSVYFDWANIENAIDIDYQYRPEQRRDNNPTGSRFNFGARMKL